MTLSDSRPGRHQLRRWRRNPHPLRVSPDYPDHLSGVPCPLTPAGRDRCSCRLLPCPTRPSPFLSRVGIRNFTFEACSSFTHLTAYQIVRPPKVDFVTRLQFGRLNPSQLLVSYRALPMAARVGPSPTGDLPLGARDRAPARLR